MEWNFLNDLISSSTHFAEYLFIMNQSAENTICAAVGDLVIYELHYITCVHLLRKKKTQTRLRKACQCLIMSSSFLIYSFFTSSFFLLVCHLPINVSHLSLTTLLFFSTVPVILVSPRDNCRVSACILPISSLCSMSPPGNLAHLFSMLHKHLDLELLGSRKTTYFSRVVSHQRIIQVVAQKKRKKKFCESYTPM